MLKESSLPAILVVNVNLYWNTFVRIYVYIIFKQNIIKNIIKRVFLNALISETTDLYWKNICVGCNCSMRLGAEAQGVWL